MRDRDDIPLETTEGRGGRSGIGDRLVVGLAALALLGGVFILVGKGLGGERRDPSVSGSPRASATASGVAAASVTPNPSPQVITLQERLVPSAASDQAPPFSGWIQLERDLPIYADTTTASDRVGALAKGSLAYAEEAQSQEQGIYWLQIDAPNPNGYIAAGTGGKLFVHRYLSTPTAYGGGISGIAAGPRGFVAWGNLASRSNRSPAQFVAASAGGRVWQIADTRPFGNAWIRTAAYGPVGWIALGSLQTRGGTTSDLWILNSSEGLSWRSLGALPMDTSDVETGLLASDQGYLLLLASYQTRTPAIESWWSNDGKSWTRGGLPEDVDLNLQHVVATRSGFYAWPNPGNGPKSSEAKYSADGRNWSDLAAPPTNDQGRVLAIGDELLAVDSSPVTGAPRAWIGTFAKGGVTWSAVTARLPRDFALGSLASDGSTALLFGWSRATDDPQAWALDGRSWRRLPLPTGAFGGVVPGTAVGSTAGFVVVGSNMNLRADNPVFWSGTAAGGWAPEASPVVSAIGEQTDLHCPSKPVDAAAFASLDIPSAVVCFGRAPISFRAFVARCDGCTGPSGDVYTPAWLADPQQNQLYLSPVKTEDSWWFSSRRAASLADDPAWVGKWVQVTGHFDDPASTTCQWVPDPHSGGVFYSRQSVIDNCRTQFVVTRMQVVAGP